MLAASQIARALKACQPGRSYRPSGQAGSSKGLLNCH